MASSPFRISFDRTPAPCTLHRLGKRTPYRTYHVKTVEEVNADSAFAELVSEGLAALKQLGKEDAQIERAEKKRKREEEKRKREEEKSMKKIMGGPCKKQPCTFAEFLVFLT